MKKRAKTTDGLRKGMSVKIRFNGFVRDAVITYIYDKWHVGTTIGSCWAQHIVAE